VTEGSEDDCLRLALDEPKREGRPKVRAIYQATSISLIERADP
jgi:hypothetical protein